ncbi:MAG: hypothetical protein ABSD92_09025 [Candidatus Bathyarchaeia archaeon]|jgi:hypothetical protein
MSMMKTIFASEGPVVEERQIDRLKKEIKYLTDELQYREDKLEKLRRK